MSAAEQETPVSLVWTDYPTEVIPIDRIHPYPGNPWLHSERQKSAVSESVDRFGLLSPPVYNRRTQRLVDGNLRWELAVVQGTEALRCRVVDWSEEEEKAAIASINRTGLLVERDDEQLAALLRDISDREGELPPGWGEEDLAELLAGLSESRGGMKEGADPDAIPSSVQTRCQPGDLWQLGEHRLLCGDCTDAAAIDRLMKGEKAVAVLTDPPYQSGKEIANDDLGDADYTNLHEGFCRALPLADDATLAAFHSPRTFPELLDAGRASGLKFERLLWVYRQNNMTYPWRGWTMTGDVIVLMSRGRGSWHGVEPIHHDTYILQVAVMGTEDFPSESSGKNGERFVVIMRAPQGGGPHPTIKSEVITADVLTRICPPGGICFDPFAGSGTTLISCEKEGRIARCMEIVPQYADVILTRWEIATGREAQLLARNG